MINTEFLITGTGSMAAVGGVLLCAWVVRGRRWRTPREGAALKRVGLASLGAVMTIIGFYIAMKSYIEDSGWGQWLRSAIDWLLPLVGTTLIVVGAVVALWALLADRSGGRKRCPRCWYDMDAVPALVCPECGKAVKAERGLFRTHRHWRAALIGLLLAAIGCAQFAEPWYRRGLYLKWIPTRILIYGLPSYKTNMSRGLWELEARVMDQTHLGWSTYGRIELPRLKPMSATNKAALSLAAVGALQNPRHPARQFLFELMPEYLIERDVPRAEPVVLAGLADRDELVQLGALRTLRKFNGFDKKKATDAVLAMLSATTGAVYFDSGPLNEAVAYLGDVGSADPRVLPALLSMLPQSKPVSSFGWNPGGAQAVLLAIAKQGQAAKSAKGLVALFRDDPTGEYALRMISGPYSGREAVLVSMTTDSELDESCRLFAVEELATCPPSDGVVNTLARCLNMDSATMRLAAADTLLRFGREQSVATKTLERLLRDTELTLNNRSEVPLEIVLEVYIRNGLDVAPVEARALELKDQADRRLSVVTDEYIAAQQKQMVLGSFNTTIQRIKDYRAGRLTAEQVGTPRWR